MLDKFNRNDDLSIYAFFALLVVLITSLVVMGFYLNHPQAEPLADTWSYLYVVDRFQTYGQLVNFWRLPGYPLFIILVYAFLGQGNLTAVSEIQAILFVLATLELYSLAALVFRQLWIAFLIGLLVGTNITLLSYVKPIMSETLALWLVVSLALAVVYFLYSLRALALWFVTAATLLLFMTRPEWIYLPVPLFAYLLLIAAWRGKFRALLLHAILSVTLLYAVLGAYIYINATQNHFPGLTWIQNINELGKVLQYNMQDEVPAQYAKISRILDTYTQKGLIDPYPILQHQPTLSRNGAALAGKFSQTIIEHHPVEFLVKSVPVFFSSLTIYYDESRIVPGGPFGKPLSWLHTLYRAFYGWNILFLPFAVIWLLLLCLSRTRQLFTEQTIGAIILLSLYGLITTTFGAYRDYDYMRIHTLFDPLLILVISGTLMMGVQLLIERKPIFSYG